MTKQRQVYETLRERILAGELVPGTRLVLHDVATKLGVSPIPVREAMCLLERDGLVELRPHKAVEVKALPLEEALWAAELRVLLEPLAAREATPHRQQGHVAAAERALAELSAGAPSAAGLGGFELYYEFHAALVAATPNQRLVRQLSDLWQVARRFRSVYRDERPLDDVTEDLAAILFAFRTGDAETVFDGVKRHRVRYLAHLRTWAEDAGGIAGKGQPDPAARSSSVPASLINIW